MSWIGLFRPNGRQLAWFAVLLVLGWGVLVLSIACVDGVNAEGKRFGYCGPIGGRVSWLLWLFLAYVGAALIARRVQRPAS